MASTAPTVAITVFADSRVRVTATFQGVGTTTNADPSAVVIKTQAPTSGATPTTYTYGTDAALVKDATGVYHLDFIPTVRGIWAVKVIGSGATGINAVTEVMVKCETTVIQ